MSDSDAIDAVDMLDEAKVRAFDNVLLGRLTAIERHLFRVLDETAMCPAELALQSLFGCGILSERRGSCAEESGGALNEDVDRDETFCTDIARELEVVYQHVQDGFRDVAVDLCEAVAELCDVDGDELVCVADTVIEVAKLVEGHVTQVSIVNSASET